MQKNEFIDFVSKKLKQGENVNAKFDLDGITYEINFIASNPEKGINIPAIIAVPLVENINNQIMLQANNLETNDLTQLLSQSLQTGAAIAKQTQFKPCPIVVPVLPSEKNGPYYQQLSKECFDLSSTDINYRLDEQVVNVINLAKHILKDKHKVEAKEKIFLNGYSSSGVFAQRFSLIHPELIESACIGGASGSIPVPSEKIEYPIGIKDYENLFNKKFDYEAYSAIKFRYYVGEFETVTKSESRYDENNMPAPMHDMSYFNRSVPFEVGQKQRELFGKEMFERANNTVEYLHNLGINISHFVINGRMHSNNKNGIGVNELGDRFIRDCYKQSFSKEMERIK